MNKAGIYCGILIMIDTSETETINVVLNPSLHWKLVEYSGQCCCTYMSGRTEYKSGCMTFYVLKCIQFVVGGDTLPCN